MNKRLQVQLSDDAWSAVSHLIKTSNTNFNGGNINFSDAINEMILCSTVDIKTLQIKHTNLRRSLRSLASQKEIDVDAAIESLMALKKISTKGKKKTKLQTEGDLCTAR